MVSEYSIHTLFHLSLPMTHLQFTDGETKIRVTNPGSLYFQAMEAGLGLRFLFSSSFSFLCCNYLTRTQTHQCDL